MCCGFDRLDAAALIDRDVDDDCTRLHQLQILATNESWRDGSRNENRADDQIRGGDLLQDVMTIGVDECDVGRHHIREVAESLEREIQHRNLRT